MLLWTMLKHATLVKRGLMRWKCVTALESIKEHHVRTVPLVTHALHQESTWELVFLVTAAATQLNVIPTLVFASTARTTQLATIVNSVLQATLCTVTPATPLILEMSASVTLGATCPAMGTAASARPM